MNRTEERLREIHAQMESWNAFVRELNVPGELVPAFATGRIEMVKLARPRALTEAECKVMFELVGGLLETNAVLREHASLVGDLVLTMEQSLKGSLHAVSRVRDLAQFRNPVAEGA